MIIFFFDIKMERPTYIPLRAWNIMSDNDKKELFKNQKVQTIITINSDTDDLTSENIIKVETKQENITNTSLNNTKEQKKTYINFYKNKLFELKHGSWKIRNNWRREQLQLINKDNVNIPNKVYNLYYEYPLNINNITSYKLFLDGREINNFNHNILLNEWNEPREYIMLIYLKNNKYPICYEYHFSDYSKLLVKEQNGYNIYDNQNLQNIKDDMKYFEAQIFILENL